MQITFIKKKSFKERLWKGLNLIVGLVMVANLSYVGAWSVPAAHAATTNSNVNLDQYANGKLTPPGTAEWQNGNLNSNNSHYVEGEVVPFRLSVTGLSAGTHTIHLNYDFTSGGIYSYDYLANWNQTENPDVCDSLTGFSTTCATTPASAAIPVDPANSGFQSNTQAVLVYGASSASLGTYALSGPLTGNSTKDIELSFTVGAGVDQVLIAWGGHLASSIDHGAGKGAASISGSPFHMRTQQLDNSGNKNQDRSIQPGAVLLGSVTVTKIVDSGNATPDQWSFTISPDPAGTGPISPAPGTDTVVFDHLPVGTYAVSESQISGYHQVSSTCSNLAISGSSADTLDQSCEIHNAQDLGTVTFEKIVVGGTAQPSDWDFTIDGVNGIFHDGDTVNLAPGQYQVTESGPSGYTSTSATGICDYLKGQTATLDVTTKGGTCTFTNTRNTGDLLVLKNVDTDGDGKVDITNATNWTWDVQGGPQNTATGTSQTLDTGTYTINEDQQPGYHVTDLTCDGQSLGAVESAQVSLTEKGLTCSFTNTRDTGSLKLEKALTGGPNGYTGPFSLHYECGTSFIGDVSVAAGASQTVSGIPTGTSCTVSEPNLPTAPQGYTFGTPTFSPSASVTIPAGDGSSVTVTTNNSLSRDTGDLKVIKLDQDQNRMEGVKFTIDGTEYTTDANGEISVPGLNTGDYTVQEAEPIDYTFSSVSGANCTDANPSTATVVKDTTTTCTFTNVRDQGTIELQKVWSGTAGSTTLQIGTSENGDQVTSYDVVGKNDTTGKIPVDTGDYFVSETGGLTNYDSSLVCSDNSGPVSVNQLTGEVHVAKDQDVVCVFTNTRQTGQVTFEKIVRNFPAADLSAFHFAVDGNGDYQNGDSNTFDTGTYTVTENAVTDYHIYGASGICSYDAQTGTITMNVTAKGGTCTIINERDMGQITIIKQVVGGNADPLDWRFQAGGTSGMTSGDTTILPVGDYSLREYDGPDGYTLTNMSGACSLGTPSDPIVSFPAPGYVHVTTGSHTCVVTNTRDTGHLTVIKQVNNNHGGNALASNFTLYVKQSGNNIVSPFAGSQTGTDFDLPTGTYNVSEDLIAGYSQVGIQCDGQATNTITVTKDGQHTCVITNTDITPSITLTKDVINDNGGDAVPNDFGLTIGGTPVTSGQTLDVNSNTPIALNEAGLSGYTFKEITGDKECPDVLNGTVTLDEGQHISCTIVNDDIAPTVTLNKVVINDNGGTAGPNDFGLTVDGKAVNSGQTVPVDANTPIALNEAGRSDYNFVDITGDAKCPDVLNGTMTLDEGEDVTCTITNDDIQPRLTVTKIVINDNGGTKQVSDFPLFVDTTTVNSGDQNGFNAGDYVVSETGDSNYAGTISGDCDTKGNISLKAGDVKACVITNNDKQAGVNITKAANPDPVEAGGVLDYTLTWEITGDGYVDNAIISDTIPLLTSYVPASISCDATANCTPDDTTNDLSWNLGNRQAGDTGTVSYQVTVDSPLADGTSIENTACIDADAQQHDCDTITTKVHSDFTVSIDKSAPATTTPGAQFTYTLDWATSGNAPIDSLIITDPLPANETFVSADNGGTYDANTNTVTWDLGPHTPGDTGTVTFVVDVAAAPLQNGTQLVNTGTVCGQSFTRTEEEVVEHCDDDTTTTTVESAPTLSIVKTNSVSGFTNPGKSVTYSLVVTNDAAATDSAYHVIVTDTLPSGFSFVTGSASIAPASVVGQVITWNAGDLAPGATFTVTYDASISATQAAGTYTNVADANADNHSQVTDDSNVEVRVPQVLGATPEIDLSIEKSVDPKITNPGKIVVYTVTIRNSGNADATNVVVTDTLPEGLTFVEGGERTKTFNIGTLKANHERVMNYEVLVSKDVKAGVYQNTAVLTADGSDPLVAQADLEVRVPRVLGLATTGVGLRDYLIFLMGLTTLGLALYAIGRLRRRDDGISA